jgi:cytochrome c biogenesis protein CcdA
MLGQFGASLPEPILSRLGPLKGVVDSLGIASLGGGAAFVETWAWVIVGALVAFFAPNTQEIMGRFDPALPEDSRHAQPVARRLAWQPSRRSALAIGLLFALACWPFRPTEFLYFQF